MCDTVVVIGDDGVLFAKNSDRDANEGQGLEWHPAVDHEPDTTVECTWITVPQAARTHAVLLSRPFWMWGAEMGANEHGVVIGNEAVFTRRPEAAMGLTGMDLLRLGLERATDAEEAVATIVELLERHGQGGGCGYDDRSFTYHNSFLVADPSQAVVLETAGAHWATEAVSRGARSISNGLTIAGFAEAHSDRIRTRVSACRHRRAITQAGAERATTPQELMTLLRDHGPGRSGPRYAWLNGGMAAPCLHGGGVVTNTQTTASWVADLRPGQDRHWVTATAAPCTSLFKPVQVDQPIDVGPFPGGEDDGSLWWRHERLHRRAVRDPSRLFPRFTPDRDRTELSWLADPPPGAEAFVVAGDLLDRWTRAVSFDPVPDTRPPWARRYWARQNARARLDLSPAAV
jgi:dipeptidase